MRNPAKPVLEDTCLCTIVRNEEINPAGGIARFLQSHIPFFGGGAIIDTGSRDRTFEIANKMRARFPHMKVLRTKVNRYDTARNISLQVARAIGFDEVLVLDTDELLTSDDLIQLANLRKGNISQYSFALYNLYPDRQDKDDVATHNPRLFKLLPKIHYIGEGENGRWEQPFLGDLPLHRMGGIEVPIAIKHFCPDGFALRAKHLATYGCDLLRVDGGYKRTPPRDITNLQFFTHPTKLPWKQFNPKREDYQDTVY